MQRDNGCECSKTKERIQITDPETSENTELNKTQKNSYKTQKHTQEHNIQIDKNQK